MVEEAVSGGFLRSTVGDREGRLLITSSEFYDGVVDQQETR